MQLTNNSNGVAVSNIFPSNNEFYKVTVVPGFDLLAVALMFVAVEHID